MKKLGLWIALFAGLAAVCAATVTTSSNGDVVTMSAHNDTTPAGVAHARVNAVALTKTAPNKAYALIDQATSQPLWSYASDAATSVTAPPVWPVRFTLPTTTIFSTTDSISTPTVETYTTCTLYLF